MVTPTFKIISPVIMKSKRLVAGILFFLTMGNTCSGQKESNEKQRQSLGEYWFVMYSKGTRWQDSTTKKHLDQDHIDYIINLRKTGKIITGGAFSDRMSWTGFEIFSCKTKE